MEKTIEFQRYIVRQQRKFSNGRPLRLCDEEDGVDLLLVFFSMCNGQMVNGWCVTNNMWLYDGEWVGGLDTIESC